MTPTTGLTNHKEHVYVVGTMEKTASMTISPGMDELDDTETVLLIIGSVLFVPTLVGNMLVLVSIYKFTWLQTPLNYLIGNLAFSDLLIGLLGMPLDAVGSFLGFNRYEAVCLTQLATMMALLMSSLLTMVAISIERCFSVTYPHKHRAMRRQPYVTGFIVVCWFCALTFSALPLLGYEKFETGSKCRYHLVWPERYRHAGSLIILALVVIKIVFFSITVKVALKHVRVDRYSRENDGVVLRRRMAKTYVLIFISALFIVCWAPYCIVSWTRFFLPHIDSLKEVQDWTIQLAFLNAAINWLIYGLKNESFRKAFGILLCRQSVGNVDERPSSS